MRLDRWLSTLGIGSRTKVTQIIKRGAVNVNGKTVVKPETDFDTERSTLTISGEERDGRLIRHVMMNKPEGVLSAARDPKQKTVMDLLPPEYSSMGCMPVGRLDKDTTGLLIFTTDGELNHRLLSPRFHVDKTYYAVVTGKLTENDKTAFLQGIELSDFCADPAILDILSAEENESTALLTIHEGKFHQVKRMYEATGHTVTKLSRVSFGPLKLGDDLPQGGWRELTETEVKLLKQSAGIKDVE